MEPRIRPERVAIYIRWSTEDQSDGTTLEVQLEGCRHYILSQGWQVNEKLVFVDDGYSGGNLDRPALTRLRRLVNEGAVDCVVVFKLDRLSRSVQDMVNLVLGEWDGCTHVKSAREPLDTATAIGKQFFYMLVSFAEWERNVIRERTHGGKLKRAQEGKNPGFKPPYGYERGETPGSLRVIEHEAAVIRRMFELYVSGMGCRQICRELNESGVRFRGGNLWGAHTVSFILQNRIYVGDLVWGRRPVNPKHGKPGGGPRQIRNGQPIIVSGGVTPIISRELFAQAMAMRKQRSWYDVPNRSVNSDHLLTGILKCMKCGGAMYGRKSTWVKGRQYYTTYYVCSRQGHSGRTVCEAGYIRQDILDQWIVDKLLARYGGELGQQRLRDDMGATIGQQLAEAERRLESLRAEWTATDDELKVLGRDYRREKLTVEEYKALKADVDEERRRLSAAVAEVEEQVEQLRHQQAHLAALEGLVVSNLGQWDALDWGQKKHVLRQLVKSLKVYKAPRTKDVEFELEWVGDGSEATNDRGCTPKRNPHP